MIRYTLGIAGVASAVLLGATFVSAAGLPPGTTLYTGTASAITTDSFTLSVPRGPAYTVQVGQSTKIWNKAGVKIPLSSITAGDSIRVDGTVAGNNTLTAAVIRDTSK